MLKTIKLFVFIFFCGVTSMSAQEIVHDAEYYILKAQHGEKWEKQDKEIQKKQTPKFYRAGI